MDHAAGVRTRTVGGEMQRQFARRVLRGIAGDAVRIGTNDFAGGKVAQRARRRRCEKIAVFEARADVAASAGDEAAVPQLRAVANDLRAQVLLVDRHPRQLRREGKRPLGRSCGG